MDRPGLKGETFKLKMNKSMLSYFINRPTTIKIVFPEQTIFKKKDVVVLGNLIISEQSRYLVIKVYKMTWWKKLLTKLKIKKNWFIGVKVKIVE